MRQTNSTKLLLLVQCIALLACLASFKIIAKSSTEQLQAQLQKMPSLEEKKEALKKQKETSLAGLAAQKERFVYMYYNSQVHAHKHAQLYSSEKVEPTEAELAEFRKYAEQKYQEDYDRDLGNIEKSISLQLEQYKRKKAFLQEEIAKSLAADKLRIANNKAKNLPQNIDMHYLVTGRGDVGLFSSREKIKNYDPEYSLIEIRQSALTVKNEDILGITQTNAFYSDKAAGGLALRSSIEENKTNAYFKTCTLRPSDKRYSIGKENDVSASTFGERVDRTDFQSKMLKTMQPIASIWRLNLEQGSRCELLTYNPKTCKITGCIFNFQFVSEAFLVNDKQSALALADLLENENKKRAASKEEIERAIKNYKTQQELERIRNRP